MLNYGNENKRKKKKKKKKKKEGRCHLRLNRQNRARLYFGLLFLLLVPSFFF
jgi:hypothetical protein